MDENEKQAFVRESLAYVEARWKKRETAQSRLTPEQKVRGVLSGMCAALSRTGPDAAVDALTERSGLLDIAAERETVDGLIQWLGQYREELAERS